jgi:ribosomal protein L27
MPTYTVVTGDVILADINATLTGVTLTYTYGFNFHPGENVQKQLDKTIYIIRKPGVPVGYEIGLGERIFNITTTIKSPVATVSYPLKSISSLNSLCNNQYNTIVTTTGNPSYGALKFYYYGDKIQATLYTVMVKSLWYEQTAGKGTMFDIRISLTEVEMPGS